ncbi:hypothetical protein FisN_2Hh463 [Fistulifera solaris]|uniref:Uncharacterized protein n=1 Tax=Fistulifera solaris TaxID=1519565 RepID=A0A1Z5JGG2_FISSO|nr:hypothetical protein FisN_2Hh463 [Fistulifera solaris]|eukprot:GAX12972.1 hypothetical protein FisN_2Hh463 [Fistulifera solaris]
MSDDDKPTAVKEDVVSSDTPSMSSETETQYPLDIPSPILLATSMLLAISSVGSLFQMMDSSATPVSAAIALIGLPLCLFFFYAAITKAQAETEADDKAFLRDQRGVRNPNDFFN